MGVLEVTQHQTSFYRVAASTLWEASAQCAVRLQPCASCVPVTAGRCTLVSKRLHTYLLAGPNTPEGGSLTRRALDTGTTAEAPAAQSHDGGPAEVAAGLPLADQAARAQAAASGRLDREQPQQKRRGMLRKLLRRASSSFTTKIQQ